jgi:hypothetical protein
MLRFGAPQNEDAFRIMRRLILGDDDRDRQIQDLIEHFRSHVANPENPLEALND